MWYTSTSTLCNIVCDYKNFPKGITKMIKEVLIQNFKCFKKLTIPEFGRINLITGRNNVGKTSLLEALFLFHDRTRPDKFLRQLGWRGMQKVAADYETLCSPYFYNYNLDQKILISIKTDLGDADLYIYLNSNYMPPNIQFDKNTVGASGKTAISTEALSIHSIDMEYIFGGKKEISHHFTNNGKPALHLETDHHPAFPACFFASKLHPSNQQMVKYFSDIAQNGREKELIKIIKIIEPRLESLKILTVGNTPYVHGQLEGLDRSMPINLMGEGLEKLLHIASTMLSYNNSCIFIDEIENGFFHSVMPKIWEALDMAARKYNCQIIATTHSYECITAAHEGLSAHPDDFRFIRLDREDGNVTAKLLNYDMVGKAIRSNMDIR